MSGRVDGWDLLYGATVVLLVAAVLAWGLGPERIVIGALFLLLLMNGVLILEGVRAFAHDVRGYPARLLLVMFVSAFDYHLTGTPWHQRRYCQRAWTRYGPSVLRKTPAEVAEWLAYVQQHWGKSSRLPYTGPR